MNQNQTGFDRARQFDLLCDRYEERWASGKRLSLREFVSQSPESEREELLRTLLPLDVELRRSEGEEPTVNSYLEELPEYWKAVTGIWLAAGIASDVTPDSETSEVVATDEQTFDVAARAAATEERDPSRTDHPHGDLPILASSRYRILRKLGQGAMGSVYLAEDTQLNRPVALKLPRSDALEDPVALSRFYREAQSAAQLRHPGICPVYDLGECEGTHFISMAWIDGQSLSELLKSGLTFEACGAAALILKLARALGEAHRLGVVHRDLKPANIMIDHSGEPVITDFGLAQLVDRREDGEVTREDAIIGSPAYMSPEQAGARREEVGPASDVYSLGVILYRLLTGRLPFLGTTLAILAQRLTTEPPPSVP